MQDEELAVPIRCYRFGILGSCIVRYLSGIANSPCSDRGWILEFHVRGTYLLAVPAHDDGLAVWFEVKNSGEVQGEEPAISLSRLRTRGWVRFVPDWCLALQGEELAVSRPR